MNCVPRDNHPSDSPSCANELHTGFHQVRDERNFAAQPVELCDHEERFRAQRDFDNERGVGRRAVEYDKVFGIELEAIGVADVSQTPGQHVGSCLEQPTDDTLRLVSAATTLLRRIFRAGFRSVKAGVTLTDFRDCNISQGFSSTFASAR